MKLFGVVGWSGSGKTTLVVALVSEIIRRGLSVSTLKHTHHSVDLDRQGKDTHRHRQAGATEVALLSASRWTLMHELRGAEEPTANALAERMTPVDLLLVEGFKQAGHPKLEVHRPVLGKPLLSPSDPRIVAVASDQPLIGLAVPCLALDDVVQIADFVLQHCALHPPGSGAAA